MKRSPKCFIRATEFPAGRELRLVQEYFLAACSVRDIVRRYQRDHANFDHFADKVAVQLNDTHPTLAVVELMRIFIDENDMPWERAWEICTGVFAYTNHTLMAEALEKWPVTLIEHVLPRHMQIIYEINRRFLEAAERRRPDDPGLLRRTSLIEEGDPKQVRMAHLAIVGSHSVNGVAAVHSELVKKELVPDFYALFPERFNNKTNGVTQRRWLLAANPGLAALATEAVGDGWITDLDQLHGLEKFSGDAAFRERFLAVKQDNKRRMTRLVRDLCGVTLDADALFDVQVKRFHEYKRQLLNVLHLVYEYLVLADDGRTPPRPRTVRVRRQGGAGLPGRQADHPPRQRRGGRRQRRSALSRLVAGGVRAGLPRIAGGGAYSRGRPE